MCSKYDHWTNNTCTGNQLENLIVGCLLCISTPWIVALSKKLYPPIQFMEIGGTSL